jgi:hypothetical protein
VTAAGFAASSGIETCPIVRPARASTTPGGGPSPGAPATMSSEVHSRLVIRRSSPSTANVGAGIGAADASSHTSSWNCDRANSTSIRPIARPPVSPPLAAGIVEPALARPGSPAPATAQLRALGIDCATP